MAKAILYDKEARQKLLTGVEKLAKAVTSTLGPKGSAVALGKKWVAPHVVRDGVTVAREIDLEDPFEDVGAQLVKEAASKTNDRCGDGTTTSILLAYELVKGGMKFLEEGVNPMTLKKGMDHATQLVTNRLVNLSQPVDTKEKIIQVGTISSSDPKIGEMIATAMEKVGKDGVITVEESSAMETTVETKEGMEFDTGFTHSFYLRDKDTNTIELSNPLLFITDQKINNAQELMTILQKVVMAGEQLDVAIICDSIDGEALQTMQTNVEKDRINAVTIFAPGFAERKQQYLDDIAILTRATVLRREAGRALNSVTIEDFGKVDKVFVDNKSTKIVGTHGDSAKIAQRITQIKDQLSKTSEEFEKDKLEERLARLTGGVAIIKVGAPTEGEMKEKKERVIDAVEATKAAVTEGIVAGGGLALVQARAVLDYKRSTPSTDYAEGIKLIYDILEEPLQKIRANAGLERLSPILGDDNYGYNVETEKYGEMFEMGVVDPVKVTKSALGNAVSVAGTILSTDCIVVDQEKPSATTEG